MIQKKFRISDLQKHWELAVQIWRMPGSFTAEKKPARKELPKSRKVVELQDAVEEVESCSACYGYLIPALEMLKNDGLFEKLDTKICIGQGYRGKTGKLGVGACTCKFEHNINGCPPTENRVHDFLRQYISEQEEKK